MAKELYFSTDVLADILRRLPTSSRRRARLVCRHWRDVINRRTTEMHSRPMPLLWNVNFAVAYVLGDDLSSSSMGSCRELWKSSTSFHHKGKKVYLVGSCNGLICMCDNEERIGSAVTVVNPATGETLAVPPLPFSRLFVGSHGGKLWHKAYNFAYHPTTGKYKVVHVPHSCERFFQLHTVQVFTLGETEWREVPAPAHTSCNVAAGIVSIDGTTYWVTAGGVARIRSFDLDAECVTSTRMGLPKLPDWCDSYQLTEVHGRLGLVATSCAVWVTSHDVWLLDKGQWCHRYMLGHRVPLPHFVHGEHLLTWRGSLFYTHQLKSTPPSSGSRLRSESDDKMVQINCLDEGTLVANMTHCFHNYQTFGYIRSHDYQTLAYVETMEPLSVYPTYCNN